MPVIFLLSSCLLYGISSRNEWTNINSDGIGNAPKAEFVSTMNTWDSKVSTSSRSGKNSQRLRPISKRPPLAPNPTIPNYVPAITQEERKEQGDSSDSTDEDTGAAPTEGTDGRVFHTYAYEDSNVPGKHGSSGSSLPEPSSAAEATILTILSNLYKG